MDKPGDNQDEPRPAQVPGVSEKSQEGSPGATVQAARAAGDKIKGLVFAPETKSLFVYYWMQVKGVLLSPKTFFAEMPVNGGFVEPAIFLGISVAIYALLQAIGNLNPVLYVKLVLSSFLCVAIGALIANLVFRQLGGKGTAEGTFRVFAYSKATLLFSWISLGHLPLGGMLSVAYTLYLNVIGMEKVHGLSRLKTVIATVLLAALGLLVKLKTG